jgi:hypothetical protein
LWNPAPSVCRVCKYFKSFIDNGRRARYIICVAEHSAKKEEPEAMTVTITPNKIKRVADDWAQIAGESVEVEFISGTFYGFCSELGTLRLFKKYNAFSRNLGNDAGYSANLKRFYFRLETNF